MDILGVHHQAGLVWESFLCILGSFLEVNVQNVDILGVAKISNIFWGMPDIQDIFAG